jgi:cold-inducible RNA-binding protein
VKNIFVGNLSFDATESALRSMFEEFGTVDRVNLVTDRDTGRARGFGFVEMNNDAEGLKAIAALNGRDLDGRALNVNEARPKENRAGVAVADSVETAAAAASAATTAGKRCSLGPHYSFEWSAHQFGGAPLGLQVTVRIVLHPPAGSQSNSVPRSLRIMSR